MENIFAVKHYSLGSKFTKRARAVGGPGHDLSYGEEESGGGGGGRNFKWPQETLHLKCQYDTLCVCKSGGQLQELIPFALWKTNLCTFGARKGEHALKLFEIILIIN